MSRPRRDPRAETARRAASGGSRPRSTIEVAASAGTTAAGRPRRDPRAEAASLVVPATRRRLDRSLAGAPSAGHEVSVPPAAAAPISAAPSVRIVAAPASFVLVVPEAPAGRATAHDRQLLGAGRLLADAAGGAVVVLADGADWGAIGADRVVSEVYGADPVLPREGGGAPRSTDDIHGEGSPDATASGTPAPCDPARRADAVVAAIEVLAPRHVLFAETAAGGDLARRVAALLGEPLFAGAESITARTVTRPARAGRVEQRTAPPRLLSLLPDVVAAHAGAPHEGRAATLAGLVGERAAAPGGTAATDGPLVRTVDQPADAHGEPRDGRRRGPAMPGRGILSAETIPADPATLSLAEAAFVVSAGNGVTDFAAFRDLVAALGATPGASRVVCDAGLMPRDRQVGASGTVLAADCYLALGIAGAPQHLQGVAKCEHVVAVNTDLHAAMIERAGLAVVADAQRVMPALVALLAGERAGAAAAPALPGGPADASAGGTLEDGGRRSGAAATVPQRRAEPLDGTPGPDPLRVRVLLSAGRHPISARPAPVHTEAQATALALSLGATVAGLHAGAGTEALDDHLGQGLGAIKLAPLAADGDPLPALAAALAPAMPDLVLAGRSGVGGDDSGTLPYRLAAAFGLPLVADAVALARDPAEPGVLVVDQALPRGARRRVRVRLPAVVTVHPAAPPPRPFAYAAVRRGRITTLPGEAGSAAAPSATPASFVVEERPWRRRPRLIAGASTAGSVAERLKAATEVAGGGGRLLVDPDPAEAAREILAFLRGIGIVPPAAG